MPQDSTRRRRTGLTKYRVDRLINTASTVSQWLWRANHCSKRPQTPLVVHHLLPTNSRNHRCRRCHTAQRSVQSSTKWFGLNASSAFGNVITVHIRVSACHSAVPFRMRSCIRAGNYAVDAVNAVFSHTAAGQFAYVTGRRRPTNTMY